MESKPLTNKIKLAYLSGGSVEYVEALHKGSIEKYGVFESHHRINSQLTKEQAQQVADLILSFSGW